ncbi:hypothetical protein [Terribacillus sp. DMT04]|uniref:hypothetical protein n=1 Tax=Terribacillus sp. DMT04 TaxID=2850441 RepID=UPI001C2BC5F4|nr:hypothetical protein [Terribacillus sp. DMT04]QXE00907.1 hypothetical protein KS242_12970 [Terribacillus sp. DMT04]
MKKKDKKFRRAMKNNVELAKEAEHELVSTIDYFRKSSPKKNYSNALIEVRKHVKSSFEARKATGTFPIIWTFLTSFAGYILMNAIFNPMNPKSLINQVVDMNGVLEILIGSILMAIFFAMGALYFIFLLRRADRKIRKDLFIHGMMLEILDEKIKKLDI